MTKLYERKHFKEMTYTGLLPSADQSQGYPLRP